MRSSCRVVAPPIVLCWMLRCCSLLTGTIWNNALGSKTSSASEARYNPLQWFGSMQSSCSLLRRRAIVLQQDEALRLKSHIKDIVTQIRKSRVHSSSGSQLTGRSEVTQRCKLKVSRSLDCAYTRKRGLDEKDILCRVVE